MIGVLVADEPFALDDLIKVGAVILFMAWPALKAALNARKDQSEGGTGEGDTGVGELNPQDVARKQELEGNEAWERLMRGEAPHPQIERSEPVLMEKPAAEPRVKEARPVVARRALASERAAKSAGSAPMSDLPSTPFEDRVAPLAGVGGSPKAASAARRTEARGSIGAAPEGASGSLRARMTARGPGSEIASPLRRHSARSRVNWRRAVVLGEVLSLPLALRKDASWQGRP